MGFAFFGLGDGFVICVWADLSFADDSSCAYLALLFGLNGASSDPFFTSFALGAE
jgi:hypothetical protein